MLQRVWEAQIPIAWVVGDTVYGENLDLRTWLQPMGMRTCWRCPAMNRLGSWPQMGDADSCRSRTCQRFCLLRPSWQRLSMSEGTKGPRLFDWACVPILHRWQPDGQHWLLLRRSVTDAQDTRYYLVFAPPTTTLEQMVQASGGRWHIEEDFENTKDHGAGSL